MRGFGAFRNVDDRDSGATAVEYALLVAFIATTIVGAVGALGVVLGPMFAITW
ncbi:MAG: Flp family type IVb pilin [Actinomycetota bacterium]